MISFKYGGCTGGEFRDQQVITHDNIGYNQNFYVGGQTYKGIGATGQFNEPNSNLNEYAPLRGGGMFMFGNGMKVTNTFFPFLF